MSFDLPLHTMLGWLFSVTVKGSIVILFIAAVQLAVGRRIAARWRHTLWLLALLRLVIPVAPVSSYSLFNLFPLPTAREHVVARPLPPQVITASRVEGALSDSQTLNMRDGAPLVRGLLAVWLLGVGLLTLRMLISSLRMRRAVNRSRRASGPDPYLEELLHEAVERVGVPRWVARVQILESGVVRTPALHGLRKTTLLLPRGMSGTFTRNELRHVVLHELWHVRRFDIGISWLLSVTQAVHWFNPFVWFATARIKEERELACDELALSCLEEEERLSYGTTILKLLDRFRVAAAPVPALVGIVNHKQKMKRRLTMIASYKNRSRFSLIFVAVLAFVSVAAFTDARGGERQLLRHLDPATLAVHEKLSQRVSIDLTNASFSELLATVGGRAGVTITQAPDLATSRIQQATFTIKADNVPAHAILMEALIPFELAFDPGDNGLTVVSGGPQRMMSHEMMLRHHADGAASAEDAGPGVERKRVIVIEDGDKATMEKLSAGTAEVEVEGEALAPGTERHEIRMRRSGTGATKLDANGKAHRELTINIDENGVKSTGKLTIDIAAPPAAK